MAYNSAHTGPEIDAAVQLLGQIQDARDSTSQDLGNVKELADQVKLDANTVSENTGSVTAKAAQVAQDAVAVERARQEVVSAAAAADEARDEASLSADSAKESQSAASTSEQAAASSQLAAGLSEQVSAESASEAKAAAEQVAADREAAAASAAHAAASARDAEAVVTGGTASVVPGPGLIPIANAQGKMEPEWLPESIARTKSVQAVADAAKQAVDVAAEAQARSARFLGPSPEAPELRDDGTPLQIGDRYFNSVNQVEFIYAASGWAVNESQAAINDLSRDLSDEMDVTKGLALIGHNGKKASVILDELGYAVEDTIATHERLGYRKRLVFSLPMIHPEYDYLLSLGTRFYPQTFVIDEVAGKILLIDGVEPKRTVLMYDWPSGSFDRIFFLSATLVSEGAVIRVEDGIKYLYMRSTGDRLARWDITSYPPARSTITPSSFSANVVAGLCFTYRNGRWTLNDTSVDYTGLRSRGIFSVLDANFAPKGALDCGRWQLGIYAGQEGDTSVTKTQGICDTGYGILACMGGQQLSSSPESPYGAIGHRTFSYDGRMVTEALCTSSGMRAVLSSAYQLEPTMTEAEGIACLSNGDVFSLVVTNGWGDAAATTQGITVLQEFDSRGADFSAAAVPRSPCLGEFGLITNTVNGPQLVNFVNPASPITTITQLISLMVQSGRRIFEWTPAQIGILDVSGVPYATVSTRARLEIYDNSLAYVTVHAFNYFYKARIRKSSGVWDEQQISDPIHTQSYAFDGAKPGDVTLRNYNNDSLSIRMTNSAGVGILASLGASGARCPNIFGVNGNFSGPLNVGSYTLSTLPSASAFPNALVLVTNASGGPKWCASNGSVWQIINTTTTVS